MQAALFRWVQKIQNTMLKHTFKKSNEGDEEHDGNEEVLQQEPELSNTSPLKHFLNTLDYKLDSSSL